MKDNLYEAYKIHICLQRCAEYRDLNCLYHELYINVVIGMSIVLNERYVL